LLIYHTKIAPQDTPSFAPHRCVPLLDVFKANAIDQVQNSPGSSGPLLLLYIVCGL